MSKKYIAIVGGELFNKGAQAMTFTVINEMKDKYPDAEILLLSSMDYERPSEEKERYNFEIVRWSIKDKIAVLKGKNTELSKKLKKTILMLDVSGFALSSQRGFKPSVQYLLNIEIAKKNKIPMYLMPQSFGPFNFSGIKSLVVKILSKRLLSYPKVYAREVQGWNEIKKYNTGALRSFDIVLQSNKSYDLKKIYKSIPKKTEIHIEENAVAIIPNMKVIEQDTEFDENIFYEAIVNKLLTLKKKVYLLYHSSEDKQLCLRIKQLFNNNSNVSFIADEIDCINVEPILNKVEFIIASRYHSIIHAYKQHKPAIVLGWAVKYKELLEAFGQERYLFQVQDNIKIKKVIQEIEYLDQHRLDECRKIEIKLDEVQHDNIFIKGM